MAEAIGILTSLTLVLLVGLAVMIFSYRMKLPAAFLLLVAGMIIGFLTKGIAFLSIPNALLAIIVLLSLSFVAFNAASLLKLSKIDRPSRRILKSIFAFS